MRYGLRDIPGLLASPGRRFVIEGALFTHSWRLEAAVQLLERELQAGDVVLIKGRTNQRLERVALALQGRQVGCTITACPAHSAQECASCPMLGRGWT
jgi:hypothetical protein